MWTPCQGKGWPKQSEAPGLSGDIEHGEESQV